MRLHRNRSRTAGFTLMEIAISVSILIVGLVSLAGVLVSISHQREELTVRRTVLGRARSIVEEIKGVSPDTVAQAYNGLAYMVEGVTGNGNNGEAITVAVDTTNPRLIRVTLTASWTAFNKSESLVLESEIYNPNG